MKVHVHFTDKQYKKIASFTYAKGVPVVPRVGEQCTLHNCERPLMLKVSRVLHEYIFNDDGEVVHEVYVELR